VDWLKKEEAEFSDGRRSLGEGAEMKKGIHLVLDDEQIVDLIRILIDEDAQDALGFLKLHFKGKARELLEGG
jgi:hypothetical protein